LLIDEITRPRLEHLVRVGGVGGLALALLLLRLLGGLLLLLLALALSLVLGRFVIVFVTALALLAALAVNVHCSASFSFSLCLFGRTEASGRDGRRGQDLSSRGGWSYWECCTIIGPLEVLVLGVPLRGSLLIWTAEFLF
jgi:hypothetical protein